MPTPRRRLRPSGPGAHNGRLVDLGLISVADAEARGIEAVRQDRATYPAIRAPRR